MRPPRNHFLLFKNHLNSWGLPMGIHNVRRQECSILGAYPAEIRPWSLPNFGVGGIRDRREHSRCVCLQIYLSVDKICYFHPLPFSVSPTSRFHLLVDFTYLGMPLGMLLSLGPGQFLGSYVINWHGAHNPRSPAIEGYSTPKNLSQACVMISVVCDHLHIIFTLGFLYHRNQFAPSNSSITRNSENRLDLWLHPKKGENKK